MKTEHQKETAFLRRLILYDASPERHHLEEKLTRIQNDERSLYRAMMLLAWPAMMAVAGLTYEIVFLHNFPQNPSQHMAILACALGLGSVICLVVFIGMARVYRRRLNHHREECRRLVMRVLESRLGKPVAGSHVRAVHESENIEDRNELDLSVPELKLHRPQ